MEKLKPCPFCGGSPQTNVYYSRIEARELTLVAEVICECGIGKSIAFQANRTGFETYTEAFDKAIKAWNRRTDE